MADMGEETRPRCPQCGAYLTPLGAASWSSQVPPAETDYECRNSNCILNKKAEA